MDTPSALRGEYLLEAAWAWLDDCGLVDEDSVEAINASPNPSALIIRNINRLYDGGWAGFKAAEPEEWRVMYRFPTPEGVAVVEKSDHGNTRSYLLPKGATA